MIQLKLYFYLDILESRYTKFYIYVQLYFSYKSIKFNTGTVYIYYMLNC